MAYRRYPFLLIFYIPVNICEYFVVKAAVFDPTLQDQMGLQIAVKAFIELNITY